MNSVHGYDQVAQLLGRSPKAAFAVCVVDEHNQPVVTENAPFCFDGEPMPTRFWLIGKDEIEVVGHIESTGGVQRAESELDAEMIAEIHAQYAAARDREIPGEFVGPRPSGGVAGTRRGVKCLHAHYANFLAGAPGDVVGAWTQRKLEEAGEARHTYTVIPPDQRVWFEKQS